MRNFFLIKLPIGHVCYLLSGAPALAAGERPCRARARRHQRIRRARAARNRPLTPCTPGAPKRQRASASPSRHDTPGFFPLDTRSEPFELGRVVLSSDDLTGKGVVGLEIAQNNLCRLLALANNFVVTGWVTYLWS